MGAPLNPDYTEYHPKWYRRRMPIFWWLGKRSYTKFISRELTAVFVAYTALGLLIQIWCLASGPEAYEHFLGHLRDGPVVVLNVAALLALLFHSFTWFNLAPSALVLSIGGRRVPNAVVLLAHYGAWLGTSALVAWLLVGR